MAKLIISENENRIKSAILLPSLSAARKHLVLNVMSNVVYEGARSVLALWMTPFLVSYLGIAAFGMIPMVNTLTSYIGVFTDALQSAISRFLAIDLGEGNAVAANKTFNTALFSLIGVIGALVPVAAIVSIFFSNLFRVPSGWERDAGWLFAMAAASFFISVIVGIFSLSPFIHSRFLLSNAIGLVGLLARAGFVIFLFTSFQPHLWYAGGGILVAASISLFGYLILWRKLTPQLHIKISDFDPSRLRSLTDMGGWTLVNSVGAMMLNRIDLIMVNAYFGPAITGGYGAMVQLSLLIETLMATASAVIRPVVLLKYAQRDFRGLQAVAYRSVKLFGLGLSLPVGLMCGFSKPLISSWLGPSFVYLSPLLVILVAHQSLSLSVRPLLYINNAYNKVRWPAIVTLICGLASVIADILIVRLGLWGYIGIAASTALIWMLKNAFYMPIYTGRIMGQPWWTFLTGLIWSIIGTTFVGLAAYGLTLVYMPGNLWELAGLALIPSIVYAIGTWVVFLNRADRQLLRELLPLKTGRLPVLMSK